MAVFALLAGLVVSCGIAVAYAAWRAMRPPKDDVAITGSEPRKPGERRIVCAGDSITHATVSFDWVAVLRKRLGARTRIFNAGINGDLAWNLAERLPSIIASDPDDVVVLIGTNDVCGAQTPEVAEEQLKYKNLPERASAAFFERELARVLAGIRAQTHARLFVVTPPLLGEDLDHPVHARLCSYAERSIAIAREHGATVIPFHAAMLHALQASGHARRPGFHRGKREIYWMFSLPFLRYLLGQRYDSISRRRGLWGTPDLIHLNETSGGILADLVEAELRRAQ